MLRRKLSARSWTGRSGAGGAPPAIARRFGAAANPRLLPAAPAAAPGEPPGEAPAAAAAAALTRCGGTASVWARVGGSAGPGSASQRMVWQYVREPAAPFLWPSEAFLGSGLCLGSVGFKALRQWCRCGEAPAAPHCQRMRLPRPGLAARCLARARARARAAAWRRAARSCLPRWRRGARPCRSRRRATRTLRRAPCPAGICGVGSQAAHNHPVVAGAWPLIHTAPRGSVREIGMRFSRCGRAMCCTQSSPWRI